MDRDLLLYLSQNIPSTLHMLHDTPPEVRQCIYHATLCRQERGKQWLQKRHAEVYQECTRRKAMDRRWWVRCLCTEKGPYVPSPPPVALTACQALHTHICEHASSELPLSDPMVILQVIHSPRADLVSTSFPIVPFYSSDRNPGVTQYFPAEPSLPFQLVQQWDHSEEGAGEEDGIHH
ncbi:hypothetical protein CPB84DRAFT_1852600 [Gymnopilus junonius]|uniref:Uncharacterized protein n=1 Tax=Gymnopilus junonius TaxID=109634 RepID=A0A9P5TGB5_GYMJU|nr:hypothetical protein CPB84DRAFT_1852600 [Gymnopilus junonius]